MDLTQHLFVLHRSPTGAGKCTAFRGSAIHGRRAAEFSSREKRTLKIAFSSPFFGSASTFCLLNNRTAQVCRSRGVGARTCAARQRMRVGVGSVGQAPRVRRGAFEQLALPEAVAAGIPTSLVGCEVPYACGAGSGPIRQRAKSNSTSVVPASRITCSRAVERSRHAGLRHRAGKPCSLPVVGIVIAILENLA